MRYFIFSNHDPKSLVLTERIRMFLKDKDAFVFDEDRPELVISIGGDGRMLNCIRRYIHRLNGTAFIGISTGRLGFLCEYKEDEIDAFLEALISRTPWYEPRKMVEFETDGMTDAYLNEFRIERSFHTLICDVYINGSFFETFRGNGLNFATPTGSSAYNKSLGGPLIHPGISSYVLGEIAPISHNAYGGLNGFLLLRERDTVTLKGNFDGCYLGGDTDVREVRGEREIQVFYGRRSVVFARYRTIGYIESVRNSFIRGSEK